MNFMLKRENPKNNLQYDVCINDNNYNILTKKANKILILFVVLGIIIIGLSQIVYANEVKIPANSGFKSYMSYKAITKDGSPQKVLQSLCETDLNGLRTCSQRYVIAVGSGVGTSIGQLIDVCLQNGTVIPAIVGDMKQNKHTDKTNLLGLNGCCTEFIVDTNTLNSSAKYAGDISKCFIEWESPVDKIIIYEINVLGGN